MSSSLLPLAFACAIVQSKPAKAPERTAEPRKWEHESSDLAPDPIFQFGALKNGMRYVWIDHAEPKKHVLLRLHVNIGSLVETESELGMAHFVEHMAFNGTKSFKAGTLAESFNKQGIRFGQDLNAHTSMEETVYELDLPDAEPQRLKTALTWMADVANGLKMEEKEVKGEKGVVDEEERVRGGEGFQSYVELLTKALDGTLLPKRLPIGTKQARDQFSSKSCLAFYRRWYRPEHMTFVIAGDIGELDVPALVEETFGKIPVPKEPLPLRPDLGRPSFKHKGFAVNRAILSGGPCVVIAKVRPGGPRPYSSQTFAQDVPLAIVRNMAENRFGERQKEEKLPYRRIGVADVGSMLDAGAVVAGTALVVSCEKERWREALTAAEREMRRILERGFTAEELRKAYIEHDRTLVPRPKFPKPPAALHALEILRACNDGYVPMDDKAEKDARKVAARKLNDAALADRILKDEWNQGELVIFTAGEFDVGADPAAELAELWNAAKATSLDEPMPVKADVTARADPNGEEDSEGEPASTDTAAAEKEDDKQPDPSAFAYAQPEVVRDASSTVNRIDDLHVVSIACKNGVKALYRKKVDAGFSFGRYEVRVGEGMLAIDPAQPDAAALAWCAEQFLLAGGLGKNDWETVQAAGGGALDFSVEGDACVFSGAALGGDLNRPFEVICAYLTDAAYGADAYAELQKKIDEKLKPAETKQNLGSLLQQFQKELYRGDARLVPPDAAAAKAVTLEAVKRFLQSQLDGPVTITAVGVDSIKIEKAVFSTFARLPARRARRGDESRRAIAPLKTGLRERHDVESGEQTALIHVVYPATDRLDPATSRKLDLLEDVVNDRLRIEIREKRGGAYSPRGGVWGSNVWKGFGWVTLDVQVDPAKVDDLTKACTATMEALGTKGVTQQELDRLRTAHLGDADQALRDEGMWFDVLHAAHAQPALLDDMRSYRAAFEKVTVADLNALCKQFFVKGRENVFVARPKQ